MNPEPFIIVTKETIVDEMTKLLNAMTVALKKKKETKSKSPLIMLVKFQLPSLPEANDFMKFLITSVEHFSKYQYGKYFHLSRITAERDKQTELTLRQLDLILALGMKEDDFRVIMKKMLAEVGIRDMNKHWEDSKLQGKMESDILDPKNHPGM